MMHSDSRADNRFMGKGTHRQSYFTTGAKMFRKQVWLVALLSVATSMNWITATKEVQDYITSLSNIVQDVCDEASSLLLLHDGTFPAVFFLRHLLDHAHVTSPPPLQLAHVLTWLSGRQHHPHYCCDHNSESALTLVVFHNATVVSGALVEGPASSWVRGPLLLVTLDLHDNPKHLLEEANSCRHLSLVHPNFKRTGTGYFLTTYYPYNPQNRQYQLQELGQKSPLTWQLVTQDRFPNFHAHTLKLASWVNDFPIMFFSATSNPRVVGVGITMLEELGQRMNFSFSTQTITPDERWGEFVDGSWTGMPAQLVNGQKDLIINTFTLLHDRAQALHFSIPIFMESYTAALKLPKPLPGWLAAVHPFTASVWMAAAVTFALITLFFHMLIKNYSTFICSHKRNLLGTWMWLARALVKQPVPWVPDVPGCRPFLALWWLAALVLSTLYIGNLIASITVPSKLRRIHTLQELAHSDHPLFMLNHGSFVPGFLSISEDLIYQSLGRKLTLIYTYQDIRDQVLHNEGVFIEGTNYIEYQVAKWNVHDIYYVDEKLYASYVAWAFQKGTPWVYTFNRYLWRMKESGLLDKWRSDVVSDFRRFNEHWSQAPATRPQVIKRSLSMTDMLSSFLILSFGLITALCALLIESIKHNACDKYKAEHSDQLNCISKSTSDRVLKSMIQKS